MRAYDKLSASFVKGLKRPGKFYDGGGLMLQATKTDHNGGITKSWLFRYQIDHRERQMGLGPTRDVTLAEARERAAACRKLVAAGVDPIATRNAERMATRAAELRRATFGQCVDGFLDSHGDKWRAKHRAQWKNSMHHYCKPIWPMNVADIDTAAVLKVVEPIWRKVPITADRIRKRVGEVLGFAQARGHRPPGALPTIWKNHLSTLLPAPRDLKPVQHHAGVAYTAAPALYAKLIAAIDAAHDVNDVIPEIGLAFVMLTAVRSVEARGAKWSEIDAAKVWLIPPSRMKKGTAHSVPLSTQAFALLGRLPKGGDLLFTMNGRATHITAQTLRNCLARYAGEGFTIHGFRGCCRKWADEETTADPQTKKLLLAHKLGNATEEAYGSPLLLAKRRRLMQQWATFLAAPPTDAARVVPLRRGQRHG
jgi:integrase